MTYEQHFAGAEKIVALLQAEGHTPTEIDDVLELLTDQPELRDEYLAIAKLSSPHAIKEEQKEERKQEGYVYKEGKRYLARRSVGICKSVPDRDWKNALQITGTLMDSNVSTIGNILMTHGKDSNWETADTFAMIELLKQQNARIAANDLEPAEVQLMNQATALEHMFTVLACRAFANSGPTLENYMRLALRCQNQARSTLETLGRLKNPTVITKQMNVAGGHQQVNNHAPAEQSKQAERTIEAIK